MKLLASSDFVSHSLKWKVLRAVTLCLFFLIVDTGARGREAGMHKGSSRAHQGFGSEDSGFLEFFICADLKKMTRQILLNIFEIMLSILEELFN